MKTHPDTLGLAYQSYLQGNTEAFFTLHSSLFDPDDIPVSHFFRTFDSMPKLEQQALMQSRGKVLDVGAGTGTHSLDLQQKGFDVTALDISPLASEIMKKRGVKKVVCANFFEFSAEKYDTILFLMNGIGLIQTLDGFSKFFKKVTELLNPQGQILLDSSDLCYLFQNDDGSFDFPLNAPYYGQIDFRVEFEGKKSELFNWVYVDFETLCHAAKTAGYTCTLLCEGEHYDFLACLQKK